jgi:hypothetical protein
VTGNMAAVAAVPNVTNATGEITPFRSSIDSSFLCHTVPVRYLSSRLGVKNFFVFNALNRLGTYNLVRK